MRFDEACTALNNLSTAPPHLFEGVALSFHFGSDKCFTTTSCAADRGTDPACKTPRWLSARIEPADQVACSTKQNEKIQQYLGRP